MTLHVPDAGGELHVLILICNHIELKRKVLKATLFKKSFLLFPPAMLAAKRQDGGLFKSPPYPGYPFIMIPDLTSPYLPNGSLSPTARTVSSFIYKLYVHTRTLLTHANTRRRAHAVPRRRGVLSPTSAADKKKKKKMQASFATPHEVHSTVACMSGCSSQPCVFAMDSC